MACVNSADAIAGHQSCSDPSSFSDVDSKVSIDQTVLHCQCITSPPLATALRLMPRLGLQKPGTCHRSKMLTSTNLDKMSRAHLQRRSHHLLRSWALAWARPALPLLPLPQLGVHVGPACNMQQLWTVSVQPACGQSFASSAASSRGDCWQCRGKIDPASLFFCPHCKSILPPHAVHSDLFRVMGL